MEYRFGPSLYEDYHEWFSHRLYISWTALFLISFVPVGTLITSEGLWNGGREGILHLL